MKPGYVYILTNRRNGTLYIGVTSEDPGLRRGTGGRLNPA